jgi:uncharacterized protein
MKLSDLKSIAEDQKKILETSDTGLERETLAQLPLLPSHALIVMGIRRCGKSTLLHQFVLKNNQDAFYLNFEDLRLYDFQLKDFSLLDEVINLSKQKVLFFDEIQVVQGWELYIRQKLDQQFHVVLTGSNATLLSQELGTKLTGRHVNKELFPFSYKEFLAFRQMTSSPESLTSYMQVGGFPEYLKTGDRETLTALTDDIIYRDIAVRHNIKDVSSLKRLCSWLFSNVGNLVSPSKLKDAVGIKSPSTILEYFSYLESSYLVQIIPKFSYSLKAQMLAPKKVYVIDSGLIKAGSVSFSNDDGHLLENIVFWELRRKSYSLHYFSEKGNECDFVVSVQGKVVKLIQVCYELNTDNEDREVKGLFEALKYFNIDNGCIITMKQQDKIQLDGAMINVVTAADFLSNQSIYLGDDS